MTVDLNMQNYQHEFIEFILQANALKFGEFKLKSGRISPYFFNMGSLQDGLALAKLGTYYAAAIQNSQLKYDMLFGPAYKGIPLVCTTAIALAEHFKTNKPYCFNRKEAKDHGEGGQTVGAPLQGKVLIIDDVITAGTAIRESMQYLQQAKAQLAGVVISLNREERGQSELSAIQEIEQNYRAPVISIINLQNIIEYLTEKNELSFIEKIHAYRKEYGITA